jgi:acyl carrier protein
MESTITSFVRTRFGASIGSRALDSNSALFSLGIIDSFGMLELIAFLEGTFGVDIDPAKYDLVECDSIARIAALVTALQQRKATL